MSRFNTEQSQAFQRIVTRVSESPQDSHFFLQGPAGTGKTFLYCALAAYFRARGKIVLCVASSGIAAQLLPGGRTAHSQFKIPLDIDELSCCNFSKNSQLAALIRVASLVIWDEVPMQHRHCFEAIDRHLRDIRNCDSLFGGLPIVLGGDFAQIPPVVTHSSRADTVSASMRMSSIWESLDVLTLRQNMRLRGQDPLNQSFLEWIGLLTYNDDLRGFIPLHPAVEDVTTIQDLYHRVYPQTLLDAAPHDLTAFQSRGILSTRCDLVAGTNDDVLALMPGSETQQFTVDTVQDCEVGDNEDLAIPPEVLRSLRLSSLPPAVLKLKVGAPILLLRNLQPLVGLCNGTRLVVTRVASCVIEAKILGGSFDAHTRFIPRIDTTSSEKDFPMVIKRHQFPVQLCFAMTINKSQGQSFDVLGVDLRNPVFTHGQFYVAMSRVRDVRQLTACTSANTEPRECLNIVYPELLL